MIHQEFVRHERQFVARLNVYAIDNVTNRATSYKRKQCLISH
ncbi:hypothetical protein [Bacillus thuringiensis]|nr:hypothetical protein [Bacillus thuringiensis]